MTRSDLVSFLTGNHPVFDIVSCLSVLHHFVLGKGGWSAETVLHRISELTGSWFFFDTGEEHEEWFRNSLMGWNPDYIEDWVLSNSTFTSVERLGTDDDAVRDFASNYGRTLFVCAK